MTATALMLLMNALVEADRPWLEVRTDASCSAPYLAEQIAQRIVGERNTGLRVQVDLHGEEAGAIRAAIDISRGFESLGKKTLLAPTCEEALAAVAAVVGLALSGSQESASQTGERVERAPSASTSSLVAPPSATTPVPPARRSPRLLSTTAPRRSPSLELDAPGSSLEQHQRTLRMVGAAGIDLGTLVEPRPVLGAGARFATARGELRSFAWYGLRSTREEVSEVTERTRADFLALSVDYCHGLDEQRWLGLCGGLEASIKRTSRLEQRADERDFEEDQVEPTFGPLLSAAFAYRAARWVPELDLSLRLPLVAASGHARPGLRAAIGAALPF